MRNAGYPRWGKDKLAVLLARQACPLSASMVGRTRPLPGLVLKHFTARDVVSRWDVLEVRTRATSTTAAEFLSTLQARMPFPIRAVQVDGGSEFAVGFEQACQQLGFRLFVLPPHSPKLNGHVERANRTHTEEFHEITPTDWRLPALNRQLHAWELPTTPSALIRRSAIAPRWSSLRNSNGPSHRKAPNCNASTGRVHAIDTGPVSRYSS